MQVRRLVQVQGAQQVHIVGIEANVFEELPKGFLDEIDTLFGRVDEARIFLVKGDKTVPQVLLSILRSALDLPNFSFG